MIEQEKIQHSYPDKFTLQRKKYKSGNKIMALHPSVIRKVIKLFFKEGKQISEIVEILGISESSVTRCLRNEFTTLRHLKRIEENGELL